MKRIAFITDVHLDEQFPVDNDVNPKQNLEMALNDIHNKNITEIIFGGDIGGTTSHSYFFESLKKFSLKLILGNHDKWENVRLHYAQNITHNELYYTHEDIHYQYVYLDTSSDTIGSQQLLWLKNILNHKTDLIIFVHHPILAIETPVDTIYPLGNREILQEVLVNYNKRVTVFCGHYHMNNEKQYKNIKQYTTQSLSFQLLQNEQEIKVDNSNFGYRIISIEKDLIQTKLVGFKS
jgi:3',5'-cyclic-AMP phosphodiesterase